MNSKTKYFKILYIYRCLLSVFAQLVVANLTTLGDSLRYQTADYPRNLEFLTNSTGFTDAVGSILSLISFGNPYLINYWFQTIAFLGIFLFLNSLSDSHRKIMKILVFFPSFNLWTSIASKESIVVFAMGITLSFLYKYIYESLCFKKVTIISLIIALYLLILFKPQFLICILYMFIMVFISKKIKRKELIVYIFSLFSLLPLYIFREQINYLSLHMYANFNLNVALSTRENTFFVNDYDFFWNAPYGMFLSFWGPTFFEAMSSSLQFFSFIESFLVVVILGMVSFHDILYKKVYKLIIGLYALFWILIVEYPFGIFNPGAAIRYRADYYLLIIFIIVIILNKEKDNTIKLF